MDYNVPTIEALLQEGGQYLDGRFEVVNATEKMWERWEVLDDRAVSELGAAIEHLSRMKDAIEGLLDERGEYDFSDHAPDNDGTP